jgi:hypothetical protein
MQMIPTLLAHRQAQILPRFVIASSMILVVLLLTTGCNSQIREVPTGAKKPPQWQWSDDQNNYHLLVAMALESSAIDLHEQLPADIDAYCMSYPGLSRDQRLRFWSDLLAAIAYHESGHNPDLTYTENFSDNRGERVISRGLLQLSFESGKAYDCPLEQAAELHDPAKNIDCGVRILNKWVGQDGVISQDAGGYPRQWLGGARYWSVLRRSTSRAAIQARIQRRPYCRM